MRNDTKEKLSAIDGHCGTNSDVRNCDSDMLEDVRDAIACRHVTTDVTFLSHNVICGLSIIDQAYGSWYALHGP